MSFINFHFLVALSALAVPILIHIFNRKFNKRRPWAAMLFITDSFSSRKRRIVFEDSLILATRTLLITFLVLGLARPLIMHSSGIPWGIVFTTFFLGMIAFTTSFALWQQKKVRKILTITSIVLISISIGMITVEKFRALSRFLKLNPQDVVLVIDGSASMSRTVNGVTLFDKAIKEAEQVIKTSNSGTSFSIIIAGTTPIVRNKIPLSDRNALLSIISQLTPHLGTFNITDAIKESLSSLARGNHFGKTVIILTDGQKHGWQSDIPSTWNHFKQAFSELPSEPRIVLKRIEAEKKSRNLGIAEISFPENTIGVNTPTLIKVKVENTGDESVTAKELKLIIDGEELSDKSLGQLRPGASKIISYTHKFKRAGTGLVTARLDVDDDISWDDQHFAVQHVLNKLHVLIVDSETSSGSNKRASFFTQLALAPELNSLKTGSANDFLFAPKVINATEIINYNNFHQFDAIILCNVPRLPSFTAQKIAEFVKLGGGLLIAPGEASIPDFYNTWQDDTQKLMPANLVKRIKTPENEKVSPLLESVTHPIFKRVAANMRNDIESLTIKNHWQLDYQEFDSKISIGAQLSNNTPLMIERHFGSGHVVMYPFMFDHRDSSLVLRRSFVPILHETLHFLTKGKQLSFNIPTQGRAEIVLNPNVTASLSNSEKGLKTEFFRDPIFKDKISTSTEKEIDVNTNKTPVLTHHNGEFISIRWEGTLVPDETGLYTIVAEAKGEINVWINNKFVLQTSEIKKGFNTATTQLPLNKGGNYNIRVEYIGRDKFHARLLWNNGDGMSVIPATAFGHNDSLQRQNRSLAVLASNNGIKSNIYITNRNGTLSAKVNGSQPGIYKLFIPKQLIKHCSKVADADNTVPINISLDIKESRIEELSEMDITSLKKYIDLIPVETIEEIEKVLLGADTGAEFWRHLILAALALLLVELMLTRWIAIQRRSGEELQIDFDEHKKPSKSFLKQLSLIDALKKGAKTKE